MLRWYQHPAVRYGIAALLAGLMVGGLVTFALGPHSAGSTQMSDGSAAVAMASDQAAVSRRRLATPARQGAQDRGQAGEEAQGRAEGRARVPVGGRRTDRRLDPGTQENGGHRPPRRRARCRPAPAAGAADAPRAKRRATIAPVP